MKVYVSEENIHQVAIPGIGAVNLADGHVDDGLRDCADDIIGYWGPIEIEDELVNNLLDKAKRAKEIMRELTREIYEASQPVIEIVEKELLYKKR